MMPRSPRTESPNEARTGDPFWWHWLVLLALSGGFEALFVRHGMSLFDEGLVMHAALQLHDGVALYRDIVFPFPPGHLLAAWIGVALDPPGVIVTRVIYGAFNVALCLSLYALGRRSMPASFALLGAALLAVAAPSSHISHYLFGYRYLVFSVLALIAFSRRIETDSHHWMLIAGVWTAIALYFRLTPAVAVGCGIGIAIFAISRDWRDWLRDAALFAAGICLVVAPVLLWLEINIGLDVVWYEVIVRQMTMAALHSLPVPAWNWPEEWQRWEISRSWTSFQFRLYPLLYAGYWLTLVGLWIRACVAKQRFHHGLLLAIVTWGAIYLTRAFGRSDAAHLESAIPPACLVIAHAFHATSDALGSRWPRWRAAPTQTVMCLAVLASWIFLFGSDRFLPTERRGTHPITAGDSVWFYRSQALADALGETVDAIHEWSEPGDTILDLSVAPMIHVLADRRGLPFSGYVIPGTFLTAEEETAAIERLEKSPPAVVIGSKRYFDGRRSRSIWVTARQLSMWVGINYEVRRTIQKYLIMTPRAVPLTRDPPPSD